MFKKKGLMDEITDYMKANLKKGYTKESLRWALINQGYSKMEVERAIKRVDMELADKAPILKTKPEITYNYEVIGEDKYKEEEPKKKKRRWF